jgi:hypothetical protein
MGSPRIGGIVGCSKLLMISSTVGVDVILPSLLLGTGCLYFYYIYLDLMNR